jgi:integrase
MFEGVQCHPSILRPPSEANLRRARERLQESKRLIDAGTFSFAEEFPDYRFLRRLTGIVRVRSCSEVFDEFLKHCKSRLLRHDLAAATVSFYRRVLNGVLRLTLGKHLLHQVRYSRLVAIADGKAWSKKTYNNAISILRRAFDFGYRDHPEQHNPARSLRSARFKKKDRPRIDPFCMQDAETLIAAIRRDWGEAQGNYDEFRFFTGMRPSAEIALVLSEPRSREWDHQREQGAGRRHRPMSDEDGGRSENHVVPTSVGDPQAATGAACPTRGSRRHRTRARLLSGNWRTVLESAVSGEALARPVAEAHHADRKVTGIWQSGSLSVETGSETQVPNNWWEILAEREGFEPSKGF